MRGRLAPRDGAAPFAPCAVGDAASFLPSAFSSPPTTNEAVCGDIEARYTLHGVVVYINAEHRYYTVEAECWSYTLRESFKF